MNARHSGGAGQRPHERAGDAVAAVGERVVDGDEAAAAFRQLLRDEPDEDGAVAGVAEDERAQRGVGGHLGLSQRGTAVRIDEFEFAQAAGECALAASARFYPGQSAARIAPAAGWSPAEARCPGRSGAAGVERLAGGVVAERLD